MNMNLKHSHGQQEGQQDMHYHLTHTCPTATSSTTATTETTTTTRATHTKRPPPIKATPAITTTTTTVHKHMISRSCDNVFDVQSKMTKTIFINDNDSVESDSVVWVTTPHE